MSLSNAKEIRFLFFLKFTFEYVNLVSNINEYKKDKPTISPMFLPSSKTVSWHLFVLKRGGYLRCVFNYVALRYKFIANFNLRWRSISE